MVGSAASQIAQQIGIDRLPLVASAGVGTRPQSDQAHLLHMPLHGFSINHQSFASKLLMDAARPIEGPSRVDFVTPIKPRCAA